MPVIEYFIVPEGANWAVRVDSDSTPYQTFAEAIEAAMEVARGARRCGFAAEVFVHRPQGAGRAFCTCRVGQLVAGRTKEWINLSVTWLMVIGLVLAEIGIV
jgi:hypothetical protein